MKVFGHPPPYATEHIISRLVCNGAYFTFYGSAGGTSPALPDCDNKIKKVFFIFNFKGTFSEEKRLTSLNLSGTS